MDSASGRNGSNRDSLRSPSLHENPSILTIATRPASVSVISRIALNCWEPVSQKSPVLCEASTLILMCGRRPGAYWISSMRTGGGNRCRNRAGSSLAQLTPPRVVKRHITPILSTKVLQHRCLAHLTWSGNEQHRELVGGNSKAVLESAWEVQSIGSFQLLL